MSACAFQHGDFLPLDRLITGKVRAALRAVGYAHEHCLAGSFDLSRDQSVKVDSEYAISGFSLKMRTTLVSGAVRPMNSDPKQETEEDTRAGEPPTKGDKRKCDTLIRRHSGVI